MWLEMSPEHVGIPLDLNHSYCGATGPYVNTRQLPSERDDISIDYNKRSIAYNCPSKDNMPAIPASFAIGLFALPAAYAALTYTHLYRPRQHITTTLDLSPSLLPSRAVKIANPQNLRCLKDTRTISIPVSAFTSTNASNGTVLDDEQILARFTRGWIGGYVLAPERYILKLVNWMGLRVLGLPLGPSSCKREVWAVTEISRQSLPEVNDVLFSAFQVVDKHIANENEGGESYIDFGFGTQSDRIAGVHHFSVARERNRGAKYTSVEGNDSSNIGGSGRVEEERIRLTYSCMALIPYDERKEVPVLLGKFHLTYAMLLFREGVAEALR
jgi:hypothetical protein